MNMKSNIFISELSKETQGKIKKLVRDYLNNEGYCEDVMEQSIKNVMDDRLCLLSEFVDIEPFLTRGKVVELKCVGSCL